MTEYLTSEDGIEISVVELEKTFILNVGNMRFTLSKDKANDLARVLSNGTRDPILDKEFFYH